MLAQKVWPKFFGRLALLVLAILPLQEAWLRVVVNHDQTGKWHLFLSNWYELGFLAVSGYLVWSVLTRQWRWNRFDYLMAGFLGLAFLGGIWANHSLGDHIIGLRFSALPAFIYFLVRASDLTLEKSKRAISFAFWAVALVALVQLLSWQIWPVITELIPSLAPNHYAGRFPRLMSTFGGPNHLASYILLVVLLTLDSGAEKWRNLMIGTGLVMLAMTFSRGALLGLVAGLLIYLLLCLPFKKGLLAVIGLVALFVSVLIGVYVFLPNAFETSILRIEPTLQHYQAARDGLLAVVNSSWLQVIFGHGAGTAGPASFVISDQPLIWESWYLQLAYEYGLLGLGLLITFFVAVIRQLYKQKHFGLLAGCAALLVNSLVLHVLSDTPATAATLFALLALSVQSGRIDNNDSANKFS